MVVVRSMQLTQRKTTATFKQMDGVIRANDASGERTSYTHKCGELDKTVPMLIGVSKAVLESVIFCHQEESSWPLQEGAVLKKKFDDIFESARYSKALDELRKRRLEKNAQVNDWAEIKSSTRLQCDRMRTFRREAFCRASRTPREQSIRPKISRIDFDLTEIESSEVWLG